MRGFVFAKRTIKEIMRDPISYIFCLGFPIVMLLIMTIVNRSIPAEAGVAVFELPNLAPGIAFFGLTFVMLFLSIQVSKDRSTALIMRLHASPMKASDFIGGYTLSVAILAIAQLIITFVASVIVGAIFGETLPFGGICLSILCLLPSAMLFVAVGMIFGTLVNEKAAPGMCSIIISVVGMIGGIWMDVENLGGVIYDVSNALPFFHGVKLARLALTGDYGDMGIHLLIVCGWMIVLYALAVLVMSRKLKKDVQ